MAKPAWPVVMWSLLAIAVPARSQQQFQIDAAATSITIHVGRAGVFGFAGHDHEVVAPAVRGAIALDTSDVGRSSISLEFEASALKVTGKGEPPADVPEVQRVMLSERVLDVQRYPTIMFRSRSVSVVRQVAGRLELRVTGDLTLRGVTRPLAAPVSLLLAADRLRAEGTASLRQTDFGIRPVTAAVGTVRVKDQLEITFTVTARRP